jgi:hypothetical protein
LIGAHCIQKDQVHSVRSSQPPGMDQKSIRPNPNLPLKAARSVQIARGTRLRLSPSLRCH